MTKETDKVEVVTPTADLSGRDTPVDGTDYDYKKRCQYYESELVNMTNENIRLREEMKVMAEELRITKHYRYLFTIATDTVGAIENNINNLQTVLKAIFEIKGGNQ